MGVYCSTVTATTIVSDGAFTYMAKKTNFGDTLQGAALNRDTATEVLKYNPNIQFNDAAVGFNEMPIIFHRVTEYLLYVGIKEEYTMDFTGTLADRINSESMTCTRIDFIAVDDTKKYPTNVSSATASVPFSIRAIADNGTVNYYSAKLVMDGTGLQVKFSGDILELGKGEQN